MFNLRFVPDAQKGDSEEEAVAQPGGFGPNSATCRAGGHTFCFRPMTGSEALETLSRPGQRLPH